MDGLECGTQSVSHFSSAIGLDVRRETQISLSGDCILAGMDSLYVLPF